MDERWAGQSGLRLLGSLGAGVLTLVLVLGSALLARVDPQLAVQRPTQVARIPSPTLYPTVIPTTPTLTPPVDTPTPSSPLVERCEPPEGWRRYEVRPGDTLYALAWRADVSTYVLMQANCLASVDLRAGQILYLPPRTLITPTPFVYRCGPPPTWRVVYVQPGDTLYRLAVRYGTTIDAIRRANCLTGYTLYAGQALYLPPTPVATSTPLTLTPPPTLTPSPTLTPPPTPR